MQRPQRANTSHFDRQTASAQPTAVVTSLRLDLSFAARLGINNLRRETRASKGHVGTDVRGRSPPASSASSSSPSSHTHAHTHRHFDRCHCSLHAQFFFFFTDRAICSSSTQHATSSAKKSCKSMGRSDAVKQIGKMSLFFFFLVLIVYTCSYNLCQFCFPTHFYFSPFRIFFSIN